MRYLIGILVVTAGTFIAGCKPPADSNGGSGEFTDSPSQGGEVQGQDVPPEALVKIEGAENAEALPDSAKAGFFLAKPNFFELKLTNASGQVLMIGYGGMTSSNDPRNS